MYSTNNEGKSVAAENFIKTLNGRIYENIDSINKKSDLGYLNKLVDE